MATSTNAMRYIVPILLSIGMIAVIGIALYLRYKIKNTPDEPVADEATVAGSDK